MVRRSVDRDRSIGPSVLLVNGGGKDRAANSRDHFNPKTRSLLSLSRAHQLRARTRCNTVDGSVADAQAATSRWFRGELKASVAKAENQDQRIR